MSIGDILDLMDAKEAGVRLVGATNLHARWQQCLVDPDAGRRAIRFIPTERRGPVLREILLAVTHEELLRSIDAHLVADCVSWVTEQAVAGSLPREARAAGLSLVLRAIMVHGRDMATEVAKCVVSLLLRFDFGRAKDGEKLAAKMFAEAGRIDARTIEMLVEHVKEAPSQNQAALAEAVRRIDGVSSALLDAILISVPSNSRASSLISRWRAG